MLAWQAAVVLEQAAVLCLECLETRGAGITENVSRGEINSFQAGAMKPRRRVFGAMATPSGCLGCALPISCVLLQPTAS